MTIARSDPGLEADIPLWRASVAQYHAMIRAGVFSDDDPVELLRGWLVEKMPRNPQHSTSTRLVRTALEAVCPTGYYVDSQEPITLSDSEPEPDVMLVRGGPASFARRHPGAADLALVVEIADASLRRDRTIKRDIYAAHAIPHYWLLSLPDQQLEVYTSPHDGEYAVREIIHPGQTIDLIVAGTTIATIDPAAFFPQP